MSSCLMHSLIQLFQESFLGVINLPDEYLSGLSDAISADSLGFQENVPTRNAWNTLFGLGIKVPRRFRPFFWFRPKPVDPLAKNKRLQNSKRIFK